MGFNNFEQSWFLDFWCSFFLYIYLIQIVFKYSFTLFHPLRVVLSLNLCFFHWIRYLSVHVIFLFKSYLSACIAGLHALSVVILSSFFLIRSVSVPTNWAPFLYLITWHGNLYFSLLGFFFFRDLSLTIWFLGLSLFEKVEKKK